MYVFWVGLSLRITHHQISRSKPNVNAENYLSLIDLNGRKDTGKNCESVATSYSASEPNSPSLTRVRIFIFGRTAVIVRMIFPRSFIVML
jgi:hypothetical protein